MALVIGAVAVVTIAISALGRAVPFVQANSSVAVAIAFIYFASLAVRRQKLDAETYLPLKPVHIGLILGMVGLCCLVVFPPFAAGFALFHGWLAGHPWTPRLPDALASLVVTHLVVVAFPEEFLFRGYLQRRLDDVIVPRWRVLGAQVGWSIPLAAAIFALLHVAAEPVPAHALGRLVVFFPALLFGWLRARTGSIYAPALLHALANIFAAILESWYYG